MNINIETKNIIKLLTLIVLFTVSVFLLIRMYHAIVLIMTAFFFALALNPAVSFISKYMPGKRRGPAVALVMIIALALLSFLSFSIITPVAREASGFANTIPERLNEIRTGQTPVGHFVSKYNLQDNITSVVDTAKNHFQSFANRAVERVGQFGSGIVTSLTGFVMTVLFLLNGPQLLERSADKLYQDETLKKRHKSIATKMYGVVTGYVNGQVFVALIASMFALGVLFLLKVPYPLPLASIVFVFGLVPLIGNTIAAVLVISFTLVLKDLTTAAILVAYFILYQQTENATLQPVIQGRTTQLPPLIIFISVILGVAAMGPIGGLFAIPVAGCLRIILIDYLDHRKTNVEKVSVSFATKLKDHVKNAVS